MRESIADNVRRSSTSSAELAFYKARINISFYEFTKIFYGFYLKSIVEPSQVVIENYILITCVLEKIIQVLRKSNNATVFRILIRIQHVAFQNNQRLNLREKFKLLVPLRNIIIHVLTFLPQALSKSAAL